MRHHQICSLLSSILILLLAPSLASPLEAAPSPGEIQFTGDHYKVEGGAKIDVSVVNPVFAPGTQSTIRLILANDGAVEGLVPGLVPPGFEEEAAQEMVAEFGCLEASKLRADLRSDGSVEVLSGPVHLDALGPGETAVLEFDLGIEDDAEGPILLSLDLEYEQQIDVSFSGGTPTPLYLPSSLQLDLIISVEGEPPALELMGARSSLSPGEEGSVTLIVGNAGERDAANCTARLVAASPFNPLGGRSHLGDIPPGGVAVARFDLLVEESARAQEYRLGCEISHDGGVESLSVPLTVASSEGARLLEISILGVLLGGAALAAIWLWRRRGKRPPRRHSLLPRR